MTAPLIADVVRVRDGHADVPAIDDVIASRTKPQFPQGAAISVARVWRDSSMCASLSSLLPGIVVGSPAWGSFFTCLVVATAIVDFVYVDSAMGPRRPPPGLRSSLAVKVSR